MTRPIDPVTAQKVEWMVNDLCREFAGTFTREQIEVVMDDSVQRFRADAAVVDFVPLLASRFTRERLVARARSHDADGQGTWDVVYVSLSGGGRGQIAAALTNVISDHRVSVHSAGTAARGQIDSGVRSAIAELGIDSADAFARPVTPEVLGAADVIVTMGRSVGMFEMPPEIRHVDWRVGDPIGAPIEEMRRVCADIEYRVRDLLGDLGVPLSNAGGISVGA
ncbi:MAG: three-helix bundle dimerization domain-containing protein [Solirubrobacteraceae bacterium]